MEVAKYWVIQNSDGEFYRVTSTGNRFFDKDFAKAKHFTSKGRAEAGVRSMTKMVFRTADGLLFKLSSNNFKVRSVTVTLD